METYCRRDCFQTSDTGSSVAQAYELPPYDMLEKQRQRRGSIGDLEDASNFSWDENDPLHSEEDASVP